MSDANTLNNAMANDATFNTTKTDVTTNTSFNTSNIGNTNIKQSPKENTGKVSKEDLLRDVNSFSKFYYENISPAKFGYYGNFGVGDSRYDFNIYPEFLNEGNGSLEYYRGIRQSALAQFGGFLTQAVIGQGVGGVLEAFGDIGTMVGIQGDDYGNVVTRIGKDLREAMEKEAPIYRTYKPDSFAPEKWSWWMTNGTSLASTAVLVFTSGLETKLFNYVTKGMLSLVKYEKYLKTIRAAEKEASGLAKLVKGYEDIPIEIKNGVKQALFSRHSESMMEARGTFEEEYQSLIARGYSEEEARKIASRAAAKNYRLNWIMILQDIPQYIIFNKLLTGYGKRTIKTAIAAGAKPISEETLGILGKTIGSLAFNWGGEGFEEGYQYISNEESKYFAEVDFYPDSKVLASDRYHKYFHSGDFWTSVFWGIAGAGIYEGAGRIGNVLGISLDTKEMERLEDMKTWSDRFIHFSKRFNEADTDLKKEDAYTDLISGLTTSALKNDNFITLQDVFKKFKEENNQEAAKKLGVDDETLKTLSKFDFVKDAQEIAESYGNYNKKYRDPALAALLAHAEFKMGKYQKFVDKAKADASLNLTKIKGFSDLSLNGQNLIVLNTKKELLTKLKEAYTQSKKLLEKEKNNHIELDFINNDLALSNIDSELKKIDKEIEDTKKSYSNEDREKDDKTVVVLDGKEANDYALNLLEQYQFGLALDAQKNSYSHYLKNKGAFTENDKEKIKKALEEKKKDEKEFSKNNPIEEGDTITATDDNGKTITVKVTKVDDKSDSVDGIILDDNGNPTTNENGGFVETSVPKNRATIKNKATKQPVDKTDEGHSEKIQPKENEKAENKDEHLKKLDDTKTQRGASETTEGKKVDEKGTEEQGKSEKESSKTGKEPTQLNIPFEEPQGKEEPEQGPKKKGVDENEGAKEEQKKETEQKEEEGSKEETEETSETLKETNKNKPQKEGPVNIEDESDLSKNLGVRKLSAISMSNIIIDAPVELKKGDFERLENLARLKRDIDSGKSNKKLTEEEIAFIKGHYSKLFNYFYAYADEGFYYIKFADKLLFIRNKNLLKVLSNQKKNREHFKKAKISYYIILPSSKATAEEMAADSYKHNFWETYPRIYEKLVNGEGFTDKEIDILLSATNDIKFKDFVDTVKIGIILEINGVKYRQGLELHSSNYNNIAIPSNITSKEDIAKYILDAKTAQRKLRRAILKELLKGKGVESFGIDVDQKGHLNVKFGTKNNPLSIVNNREGRIFAVSNITGQLAFNDSDFVDGYISKVIGAVYVLSDRTTTGSRFPVQLNKERLSAEDSGILFDVIMKRFRAGGGRNVFVDHPQVSGLTFSEVFKLLGGPTPESEKSRLNEASRKRKIFVDLDDKTLTFNDKLFPLYPETQEEIEDIKSKFVEWATQNLYYNGPIKNTKSGLKFDLNEKFERPFRLGSLKYDPKTSGTIGEFLCNNGKLTTNVSVFEDTDNIFIGHVAEVPGEANLRGSKIEDPFSEQEQTKEQKEKPSESKSTKEKTTKTKKKPKLNLPGDEPMSEHPERSFDLKESDNYEKADIKEEVAEVRKMLGDEESIVVVNSLLESAKFGKKAFGKFTGDCIVVYKGAERGTLYHEAFHKVSLLLLTNKERELLYNEARERYKDELERTYNKKGSFSDREVEEFLAEKFRLYVLSNKKLKLHQRIALFFSRLYNRIKAIVGLKSNYSKYDIDRLFERIRGGKYRYTPIQMESYKKFFGDDSANEYLYEIRSSNLVHINGYEEYIRICRGLTNHLLTISDVDSLKKTGNIDYNKLKEYLVGFEKQLREAHEDSEDENEKNAYLKTADLYKEIIDNFDVYVGGIESVLAYQYKLINKKVTDLQSELDKHDDTNWLDAHLKPSYETSMKDTCRTEIKFLIANIHKSPERDPVTLMYDFVDFDKMWSIIIRELHNYKSIDEMLKRIDYISKTATKQEIAYPMRQLYLKLKNSSDFIKTQFVLSVRSYKHNFTNTILSVDPVTKNRSVGFTDADIQKASISRRDTISRMFYLSDFLKDSPLKTFDKASLSFNTLLKDFNRDIRNGTEIDYDLYLDKLLRILGSVGIYTSLDDLHTAAQLLSFGATAESGVKNILQKAAIMFYSQKSSITKILQMKSESLDIVKVSRVLRGDSFVALLADAYVYNNMEEISDSVLGPGGNQYYSYSKHTYLTRTLEALKEDDALLNTMMRDANSAGSIWLETIYKDKKARQNLKLLTHSALIVEKGDSGRKLVKSSLKEREFNNIISVFNDIITNRTRTSRMPVPQLSDKETLYFIEGFNRVPNGVKVNVTKDSTTVQVSEALIDIFYKYAEAERDRIKLVELEIEDATSGKNTLLTENDLIEEYHFKLVGKNKDKRNYTRTKELSSTPNGLLYHIFREFNREGFVFEKHARQGVKDAIVQIVIDALNYYGKTLQIGSFLTSYANESLVSKIKDEFGFESDEEAVNHIIADFAVNSTIANIEFEKLFGLNPAFFKSNLKTGYTEDDKIKRFGSAASTGDELISAPTEGFDDVVFNCFTLKTAKTKLQDLAELKEAFKENLKESYKDKSDEDIDKTVDKMLKSYESIDPTDGQSYISPEMFRTIMIKLGMWQNDESLRKAYDNMMSTEDLPFEEVEKSASKINYYMQVLKMIYFGRETFETFNEKTTTFPRLSKTSLMPLFRKMTKGRPIDKLLDRMLAVGEFSGLKKVGLVELDSAAKVGRKVSVDAFERDEKGNVKFEFSTEALKSDSFVDSKNFRDLLYQMPTDPHEIKKVRLGIQARRMILSNIVADNVYKIGDKEMTGKEFISLYNASISALSNKGAEKVQYKLGVDLKTGRIVNKKLFLKTLRDAALKSSMHDDVISYIESKIETGDEFIIDTFVERDFIYSAISKAISKSTIDTHIPGGQLIQASGVAFTHEHSKDLKFFKKKNDGRVYMEVRVGINLFSNIIPKKYKTNAEKIEFLNNNKELLSGLGYRIPTQGPNSMIAAEIVDFLPEESGDIIILPDGFVQQTGSDFDIDKLFFITYNYSVNKDGKLEKIQFKDDSNSTLEERYRDYLKEIISNTLNVIPDRLREKVKELLKQKHGYEQDAKDLTVTADMQDSVIESLDFIVEDIKDIIKDITGKKFLEKPIPRISKLFSKLSNIDYYIYFLESIGFNIPTMEEFSKRDIIEQNTTEAVQNMFLSLSEGMISSPQNIVSTRVPLGNTLNEMKAIASVVRSNSRDVLIRQEDTLKSLYVYSPVFQSKNSLKIITGLYGIGPFAVTKAVQPLLQSANVKYKTPVRYDKATDTKINTEKAWSYLGAKVEDGLLDISTIFDLYGNYSNETISGLIDAHVDLQKDPFITDIGVIPATYGLTNALALAGFGKKVFLILSQPHLRKAIIKTLFKKGGKLNVGLSLKTSITYEQKTLSKIITSYKSSEEVKKDMENLFDKKLSNDEEYLIDNIKRGIIRKIESEDDYKKAIEQYLILKAVKDILEDCNDLTTMILSTRVDNIPFKPKPSSVITYKMLQRQSAFKASGEFVNLDKIVNFDESRDLDMRNDGFLTTFYRNGVSLIDKVLGNVSIQSTNAFKGIFEIMSKILNVDYTNIDYEIDENVVSYMYHSLNSYIINSFFLKGKYYGEEDLTLGLSREDIVDILIEVPDVIEAIKSGNYEKFFGEKEVMLEGSKIEDNQLFKTLDVVDIDEIYGTNNKKITKKVYAMSTRNTAVSRNSLIYSWESLLKHENPKVRDLGNKLYVYSFFTNTFKKGVFSIYNYAPSGLADSVTINNKTASLNKYMSKMKEEFYRNHFESSLSVYDMVMSAAVATEEGGGFEYRLVETLPYNAVGTEDYFELKASIDHSVLKGMPSVFVPKEAVFFIQSDNNFYKPLIKLESIYGEIYYRLIGTVEDGLPVYAITFNSFYKDNNILVAGYSFNEPTVTHAGKSIGYKAIVENEGLYDKIRAQKGFETFKEIPKEERLMYKSTVVEDVKNGTLKEEEQFPKVEDTENFEDPISEEIEETKTTETTGKVTEDMVSKQYIFSQNSAKLGELANKGVLSMDELEILANLINSDNIDNDTYRKLIEDTIIKCNGL